jgi:hypothetical protein
MILDGEGSIEDMGLDRMTNVRALFRGDLAPSAEFGKSRPLKSP